MKTAAFGGRKTFCAVHKPVTRRAQWQPPDTPAAGRSLQWLADRHLIEISPLPASVILDPSVGAAPIQDDTALVPDKDSVALGGRVGQLSHGDVVSGCRSCADWHVALDQPAPPG
jgi:hypothetical protein